MATVGTGTENNALMTRAPAKHERARVCRAEVCRQPAPRARQQPRGAGRDGGTPAEGERDSWVSGVFESGWRT